MIELKHIERFYPLAKGQFFYVLRDVNLKIEEGDFVSIVFLSSVSNPITVVSAPVVQLKSAS